MSSKVNAIRDMGYLQVKNDHRSKFFQFKQLEKRSLKKSGLQRIYELFHIYFTSWVFCL